jgi:histidinol-phosphate/aromatic aminotransferase/cobyric acid decarboxylase-like protein
MIAKDLYRLRQQVEVLEKQLENASPDKREELEERLRKVRAERNRMKRVLDGTKEFPVYRKPL